MFAGLVTVTILSLASFAAAENSSTPYKYAVSPDSIDPGVKAGYCQSQNNVCNEVCPMGVKPGSPFCNSTSLEWRCTCANGPTPNLEDFNGTIPFFECQNYIAECQANNTQSPTKQHQCLEIQCGGRNATAYSASKTGSSSSMMPSKTPTSKPGGGSGTPKKSSGGSSPSTSSSSSPSSEATALEFGRSYGLATMIVAGMLAFGFGLGL